MSPNSAACTTKLQAECNNASDHHELLFEPLKIDHTDLRSSGSCVVILSLSTFDAPSWASDSLFIIGHFESSIENHAMSRLRPRAIICCRNVLAYMKPKRSAVRREGALKLLHFTHIRGI
jgi:hypothetical protein